MRPAAEATVVVTGANRSDGIGLAAVRAFIERGIGTVVGTYRDPDRSRALLELADSDHRVRATTLDVTSDASTLAFGQWCSQQLGQVDVLVNNAGLSATHELITRAPLDELHLQLETHAIGMLRVTRALLPLMQAGAVVVNVSSTLGLMEQIGQGATFYGPAKALQNGLTRQLAAVLRPVGVSVCAVNPGWVRTTIGNEHAPRTPAQAGHDLATLALNTTLADAGTFRDFDGRLIEW